MSLYDIHVGKLLNGKRKFEGHGYYMYTTEGELIELNDLKGSTGVVVDATKIEDLLFQHCTETINKFENTDENKGVYVFSLYTDVTHGSFIIYMNTEESLEKTANRYYENYKKKFIETNDSFYDRSLEQIKISLRFSEGDFDFSFEEMPYKLNDVMSIYYCISLKELNYIPEQDTFIPKSLMDHQLYFIGINVIQRLSENGYFKILNTTDDFIAYASSAESGDYLTYSTLMRKTIDLDTFYRVFPEEKVNDEEFLKIVQRQKRKSVKEQLEFWLSQIKSNKWRTDDNVISKYCKTDYHAYECLVNIGSGLLPYIIEKLNESDLSEEERYICEELLNEIKS